MTAPQARSRPRPRQVDLIRAIKSPNESGVTLLLPIIDASGRSIGSLSPITRQRAEEAATVQALTNWRKRYKQFFLSQFKPAPERTRLWLLNAVIEVANRVLFLIADTEGRFVGHIGLIDVDEHHVEIDNVIRGEDSAPHRIMYFAEIALLKWAFASLGVMEASLRVFSDNARAIANYRSVGFDPVIQHGLIRVERAGEVSFTPTQNPPHPGERGLLTMRITRAGFFLRHPEPRRSAASGARRANGET